MHSSVLAIVKNLLVADESDYLLKQTLFKKMYFLEIFCERLRDLDTRNLLCFKIQLRPYTTVKLMLQSLKNV